MEKAQIVERVPTPREYNEVRTAAGMALRDPTAAELGLKNSFYSICLELEGRTIGIGRVVSDGGLVFDIVDVAVRPEFQGKGLGRLIMRTVLDYIERSARANALVAGWPNPGRYEFYRPYGFVPRGPDRPCMSFMVPAQPLPNRPKPTKAETAPLYTVAERCPTVEEYNRIRGAVGPIVPDPFVVKAALGRSLYAVCIEIAGETVGFGRVVGDRGLLFDVVDVVTLPDWRHAPVVEVLLERLMTYIYKVLQPTSFVSGWADVGQSALYERYGFTARGPDRAGMSLLISARPDCGEKPRASAAPSWLVS